MRVLRLTEGDLKRVVRRVINEYSVDDYNDYLLDRYLDDQYDWEGEMVEQAYEYIPETVTDPETNKTYRIECEDYDLVAYDENDNEVWRKKNFKIDYDMVRDYIMDPDGYDQYIDGDEFREYMESVILEWMWDEGVLDESIKRRFVKQITESVIKKLRHNL